MTCRGKRIQAARRYWRQEFVRCVILGCYHTNIDGAHIYPAGSYAHLSDVLQNGVGLCRKHHKEFDAMIVENKIKWLPENCDPEFGERIKNKLHALEEIVQEYRRQNGGAIK